MTYEPEDAAWRKLVVAYADGQPICNCGMAYYSLTGKAWRGDELIENYPVCSGGCQSNWTTAKYQIARKIVSEGKLRPLSDDC